MDRYSQRPVRPVQKEQPTVIERIAEVDRPTSRRGKQESAQSSLLLKIAGIVVLIAVLGAGAWWFTQRAEIPSYVDTGKYQAVFLQNGEFYFGKVQSINDSDVQLTDVYYVQKAAPTDESESEAPKTDLELIKLGREVHGPEDMMIINRSQVLYIENLKSDARVVQLIKEEKAKN